MKPFVPKGNAAASVFTIYLEGPGEKGCGAM